MARGRASAQSCPTVHQYARHESGLGIIVGCSNNCFQAHQDIHILSLPPLLRLDDGTDLKIEPGEQGTIPGPTDEWRVITNPESQVVAAYSDGRTPVCAVIKRAGMAPEITGQLLPADTSYIETAVL